MKSESSESPSVATLRLIPLVCVIGMSLAFVGYLAGLLEKDYVESQSHSEQKLTTADAVIAVNYLEQPRSTMSPNLDWNQGLDPSAHPLAPASQSISSGDSKKSENLRAYTGAPPVIPHPVDAISVSSCLACHEKGMSLGDLSAPAIPHEPFASCTQCHAPPAEAFLVSEQLPQSEFKGLKENRNIPKNNSKGAPIIPHTTLMRDNCLACHGASGKQPMKPTHRKETVCQRCHIEIIKAK